MTDPRGAILDIDLGAIALNWHDLRARHPRGAVGGVLKADGYGLGAAHVAGTLLKAGCRHFFVAHLSEALAIRSIVFNDASPGQRSANEAAYRRPDVLLAVLNGVLPGQEREFAESGIVPVLGSLSELQRWSELARRMERRLPALLHLDTGMARLGLEPRDVELLAGDRSRLDGIDLLYVMTHLVSAELPDDPINEVQRQRFDEACKKLPHAPCSLANSSGIFLPSAFSSDLARPGAALYGVNPTPTVGTNPMRPVACLRGQVVQVREIEAGAGVGYNATFRAPRNSRIATVPIGYADGWPRSLSGRGHAYFDGRPVPLVGRVSMDLTTFDVTDFPSIGPGAIEPGCWLEFFGRSRGVDEVAAEAGTNGYEILTSLGRRYHRIYRG